MKALATVLLLLPLPVAAQTVTKTEFRSQDPRVTEREMKDQILGIFEPVDLRRRPGNPEPRRPLDLVFLNGRSYATDVPGLCRSDSAMVRFAPVGVGAADPDAGADAPVRAYGIEASARFYFLRPPTGWYNTLVDHERTPWERECQGIDFEKVDYFGGESDDGATDAIYALSLAGVAVSTGKVQPICDMAPVDKRDCAKVIADMVAEPIGWAGRCDARYPRKCFELNGGDDELITIGVNGEGVVDRVQVKQQLIMRHTRID